MRLDDNLSGAVTEYDVLRTFPYGGDLVRVKMPGSALKEVLEIGAVTNYGEGGYFQFKKVEKSGLNFKSLDPATPGVAGELIDSNAMYEAVMPSFVAKGKEANLGILANYYDGTPSPNVLMIEGREVKNDLRDIVIDYMLRQ